MTLLPPRDWGLPKPNDDPVYIELRARTERILWVHGHQGIDSRYMDLGKYHLGMFTGDGEPNLVSVQIQAPRTSLMSSRVRVNILCDSRGDFNRALCEEALNLIRTKMVLDDLADI